MYELIKRLFDIGLFKKGPQDLPSQSIVLYLLLAADAASNFLMERLSDDAFWSAAQTLAGITLDMAFSAFCLFCAGKLARFQQTTAALLGTDALITFFALPVTQTLLLHQGGIMVFLLMVALMVWHWAVIGHIIRHALDQPLSFGLGVALLYQLAAYKVMALLFP